jgi:hydroxyacylglutathione hydrolase
MGYERLANWAFQITDEDTFVREVLAGQPEPPAYFARMKQVNRDGPTPPTVEPLRKLTLTDVRNALEAKGPVVDVRATATFAKGHIPGTINIPTGTSFATWAGSLLPYDRNIVLLGDDDERIAKARLLLSMIGIDRIAGYAGADVREAWVRECGPLQTTDQVGVESLTTPDHRMIVDVRRTSEWDEGHVPDAHHLYLGKLVELTKDLPRDTPIAVHCQGGTRSAIAASLLQSHGFTDVANVTGGFDAWKNAGLPIATPDKTS